MMVDDEEPQDAEDGGSGSGSGDGDDLGGGGGHGGGHGVADAGAAEEVKDRRVDDEPQGGDTDVEMGAMDWEGRAAELMQDLHDTTEAVFAAQSNDEMAAARLRWEGAMVAWTRFESHRDRHGVAVHRA